MNVAMIEAQCPPLATHGPDIERRVLGPKVHVRWYNALPTNGAVEFGDVDALIVRSLTPVSAALIQAMPRVRVIAVMGVGYDQIDLEATRARGIPVCHVPDYGTEEVADAAVAMLLAHQRKLLRFQHHASTGGVWDWRIHQPIRRSRRMQVGIIGLGRIGTAVALRLKAFGYAVQCYDPYIPRGIEKSLGIGRVHVLEPLLQTSDAVTLHTPLTSETAGMVNEQFLRLLKPDAILINTARGGLFQSADVLLRVLKERPEFRIATDVWPDEPPSPHPLVTAWQQRESWLGDRLILCPHAAFYSEDSVRDMRESAATIVRDVLLHNAKPYNVVNGVTA